MGCVTWGHRNIYTDSSFKCRISSVIVLNLKTRKNCHRDASERGEEKVTRIFVSRYIEFLFTCGEEALE